MGPGRSARPSRRRSPRPAHRSASPVGHRRDSTRLPTTQWVRSSPVAFVSSPPGCSAEIDLQGKRNSSNPHPKPAGEHPSRIHYSVRQDFFIANNLKPHDT
jgi:hypothetical protein